MHIFFPVDYFAENNIINGNQPAFIACPDKQVMILRIPHAVQQPIHCFRKRFFFDRFQQIIKSLYLKRLKYPFFSQITAVNAKKPAGHHTVRLVVFLLLYFSSFQISSLYCAIVRSAEKKPALLILTSIIFAHALRSSNAANAFSFVST